MVKMGLVVRILYSGQTIIMEKSYLFALVLKFDHRSAAKLKNFLNYYFAHLSLMVVRILFWKKKESN